MTKAQTFNTKKIYILILNITIITFLLIGFISLIYVSSRLGEDITPVVSSENNDGCSSCIPVFYTMDKWTRYFPTYLIAGFLLYFAQLACLIINKNKIIYSFLPIFYIKKINLDFVNKKQFLTISIISLTTLIILFIGATITLILGLCWPFAYRHKLLRVNIVLWIFSSILLGFYLFIWIPEFKRLKKLNFQLKN
ncbi:hypothetical protein [Mycoplasma hafezii]|uniref:hypothetical protein n=1 Tax=Mycoplasma hafezii TaxID=525886 RepID=UPI003CE7D6C4